MTNQAKKNEGAREKLLTNFTLALAANSALHTLLSLTCIATSAAIFRVMSERDTLISKVVQRAHIKSTSAQRFLKTEHIRKKNIDEYQKRVQNHLRRARAD